MLPPPRADRVRNDERIMRSAARLLAEDPQASIQAIADAAGVNRRSVYRRYPTREDLLAQLRATVGADAWSTVAKFPGWDAGPQAFRTLVGLLVGLAARYPIAVLKHDPAGGSPVDGRIVEILTEGSQLGALRADLDPLMVNATMLAAIRSSLQRYPDLSADELADLIASHLLNGIRA